MTQQTNITIVHTMLMYQQRDYKGRTVNVYRDIDSNNVQHFRDEIVEMKETEEPIVFNLKKAKGHKWFVTTKQAVAEQCNDYPECLCCKEPINTARAFLI